MHAIASSGRCFCTPWKVMSKLRLYKAVPIRTPQPHKCLLFSAATLLSSTRYHAKQAKHHLLTKYERTFHLVTALTNRTAQSQSLSRSVGPLLIQQQQSESRAIGNISLRHGFPRTAAYGACWGEWSRTVYDGITLQLHVAIQRRSIRWTPVQPDVIHAQPLSSLGSIHVRLRLRGRRTALQRLRPRNNRHDAVHANDADDARLRWWALKTPLWPVPRHEAKNVDDGWWYIWRNR